MTKTHLVHLRKTFHARGRFQARFARRATELTKLVAPPAVDGAIRSARARAEVRTDADLRYVRETHDRRRRGSLGGGERRSAAERAVRRDGSSTLDGRRWGDGVAAPAAHRPVFEQATDVLT